MNNVETEVKVQIDYKSFNSIIKITYIFKYMNKIITVFTLLYNEWNKVNSVRKKR
jgi:hypothetical protein